MRQGAHQVIASGYCIRLLHQVIASGYCIRYPGAPERVSSNRLQCDVVSAAGTGCVEATVVEVVGALLVGISVLGNVVAAMYGAWAST
jgi:hypothetical protein